IADNNFFLVRRLVSRPDVDIRNPDVDDDGSSGEQYTSLAWAALCGHAEIFEYLLNSGHDDLELSKDEENNTILILLASLRKGLPNPYNGEMVVNDVHQASMRMARAYHERYPMLLDWANEQGKTALHIAASAGNEDFARLLCDLGADFDLPDMLGNTPLHYASAWGHSIVAQLLINRGCQYLARNNEGFTAPDFAFSYVATCGRLESSDCSSDKPPRMSWNSSSAT
ncbi:ankyrin, partial [Calocera cornea HHB12733]